MDRHVSSQIRRAKRSKSNIFDLSCLGLPRWPEDIFDLIDVQTLKINDNELTDIPSALSRLENLAKLDISNNKIEKIPSIDFDKLPNLRSIKLDGNPVANGIPATVLQQLSSPDKVPGKSTAEVLRNLLMGLGSSNSTAGASPSLTKPVGGSVAASPPLQSSNPIAKPYAPPEKTAPAAPQTLDDYMKDLDGSEGEYSDDFHNSDDDTAAVKKSAGGDKKEPLPKGATAVTAFGKSDSDSDDPKPKPVRPKATSEHVSASHRPIAGSGSTSAKLGQTLPSGFGPSAGGRRSAGDNGRSSLVGKDSADAEAEISRLQAQVKELKAQLASSSRPSDTPSKPVLSFASTLPSRLHAMDESEGADKLKQQVQDEQRKAKRLERENQKLQERMRESSMSKGSNTVPHVDLSEIQEGDILSKSGGFSVIYKGTWHGTPVAIKKLFDPSNSPENLAELDNEVDKLAKLRHPNMLSLLGVHRQPPVYSIVMEIVTGGSLFQLLHVQHSFNIAPGSAMPVPINALVRIDEAIALVLSFMHARNVAHRDVKSHNVLLTPHLEVKVCDLGLARMKSELMTGAMQFAGTPQYMAPELLRQQKYTEKVDVFAFGTLLWECMAGDIPFANLDAPEIRDSVCSGKMPQMPHSAPRPIQAVIKDCWTIDPTKRPAMAEVLAKIRAFLN
eukprot:TRINITY_DN29138_c0_g1_i2.p1 TRINITY_DN29138_c0_g1~~TRINITY_DN29138_c0_g1_i2.p1  ORF type:complete len:685 (-),score=104.04 TRINITY_DN29138_c0_g1_i2:39-2054(-)